MTRRLSCEDYTVGWVCALADEFTAAQEMLDEEHQDPIRKNNLNDSNIYTAGCIGGHNVVLSCLPAGLMGTNSAAAVAVQMKNTFPAIKFGLMVGIGGGVPGAADIRLGDIVVSQPMNGHGGVVQYDFGKSTPSGFKRTGFLNAPPSILLAAIMKLRSNEARGRASLEPHLLRLSNIPNAKFSRSDAGEDVLFEAEYNHIGNDSCASCATARAAQRKKRENDTPMVHYGTIASGNQVMRNGVERDKVSLEFDGILCFEMEAAGLMNNFPCLVIRGICDYSDSHKNKTWQAYAAGTAAAYAKELLLVIPVADVVNTHTANRVTQDTRIFYLPFLKNHNFVGRSVELALLKQRLLVDKDCQRVALSGLGGIGKTQVAVQFAHYVKEHCSEFSIFWVQALSMETFEQGCSNIAKALGISPILESKEDVKVLVRQHLCSKITGKWLLIVDNIDDQELLYGLHPADGLLAFLPESEDGLTLFTTRHAGVAQQLVGSDVVEIEKMTGQEIIELFDRSLVRKTLSPNDNMVMNLLTELEFLPLAVTQAAAYININKTSISEYIRLLKNTEEDAIVLMSTDFGDRTRYQNLTNAVAKTWVVTFDKILKSDKLAADLLAFISCIEWRAIPYSILPAAHSEAQVTGAIGTLCSYSLLERRNNETKFDMHRLVHLATRMWVKQSGQEEKTTMTALKHLSEAFPSDEYTNREMWQNYLPHVAHIEKLKSCRDTKEKSKLSLKVGKCLYADGRMKEAVIWLQKSCKWGDTHLTGDQSDRLMSQHALALAYQGDGKVKEAVQLLEHVVAVQAKLFGEDNPDRLHSQHTLARAYHADYQVEKAMELLEHITTVQANFLKEDHPDLLRSQHQLAIAYGANGKSKEAIQLLEHVVTVQANVLAEDHPDRLGSQLTLSGFYILDGQVKTAIQLLQHVIAIRASTLPEDHPDQLLTQGQLATAYQADGNYKEAIPLREHVVTVQANVLAEDHPDRLVSQLALSGLYIMDGRVKIAIQLLEHIIAIQASSLPEDHPNRLLTQVQLATAYQRDGNFKKAIQLQEHVVAVRSNVLAEDHPTRLGSQVILAQSYIADAQAKKAIQLLEQVSAVQARTLPEDHPERLDVQKRLIQAYKEDGQVKKVIQILEHTILVQAKDHLGQLAAQHALALAYQVDGQEKKAIQLLEQIIAVQLNVLTEDHPDLLSSQYTLALVHIACDSGQDEDILKAIHLLKHVVAGRARVLAEDHPDRLASEEMLASLNLNEDPPKKRGRLSLRFRNFWSKMKHHINLNQLD